jgi:hypothetical protein
MSGHLASGESLIGIYPPGYSALLASLVWLWPHSFLPLRLLSVASFAAVFPLTWVFLGRRRWAPPLRVVVLLLLALGPPFATFGSMVMAETTFLVVLLLLLLVVDRWAAEERVVTAAGLSVLLAAAALIWLKQAALGLDAGLILWIAWRAVRGRMKAAALAAGIAVLLSPVIVSRLAGGLPLAGTRYSQELGGYYQGGLVRRLVDVLPHSVWHLLSEVLGVTLVPYFDPLPDTGTWVVFWQVVSVPLGAMVVTGAVVWFGRYRDAALPMTVVYLAESCLWPFVNERRTILVLPLLAAWFVGGTVWWWGRAKSLLGGHVHGGALRGAGTALVAVFVVVPLVAQMPRDYLYGWNQNGSHFEGSRYMGILHALGRPADVVETDYRWSTALFSGHVTQWNAFVLTQPGGLCYGPAAAAELAADRAGFLLIGDLNKPGLVDSPCLLSLAMTGDWAVQLLHTSRDDATVWELIGPGTGHPDLTDELSKGATAVYNLSGDRAAVTWTFSGARRLSQISLGQAAMGYGTTGSVTAEVETPGGRWVPVAGAPHGVGDGPGRAPYLLASPPAATTAVGFRVVMDGGPGSGDPVISDVAVLGPAGPS